MKIKTNRKAKKLYLVGTLEDMQRAAEKGVFSNAYYYMEDNDSKIKVIKK